MAAAAASEVSRNALPVESLRSPISRWNMPTPRFEKMHQPNNKAPNAVAARMLIAINLLRIVIAFPPHWRLSKHLIEIHGNGVDLPQGVAGAPL